MQKHYRLLLVLICVLAVNIYYRCFPVTFPQLKKQAKNILNEEVRKRATQDVHTKFPQFDPLAKEKLIKTRVTDYWRQSGKEINKEVGNVYNRLKDRFQDQFGQTYMMELDCWHWSRYVENVVQLGHPGDETVNGRQWDLMMVAPLGRYMSWDNFLYYFSAFFYKIFSFFKHVPLFNFLFYFALFNASIFIVVLFFFAYRAGGLIAAVTACLFAGLAPVCISRSCAGWFDKDILCQIFPVVIVWSYLWAYDTKFFKARLWRMFFTGFWMGLFCFSWDNWWFIFLILIAYELLTMGVGLFILRAKKRMLSKFLRQHIVSLAGFIGSSIIWIIVFSGIDPLVELGKVVAGAVVLTKPLISSIWPNVYYTVGELRRADFREAAMQVGGVGVFTSAIVGLLLLVIRSFGRWQHKGFKREAVIILAIWFLVMYFACSKGVRFAIFLVTPLGVALGMCLSEIHELIIKKSKFAARIVTCVLMTIFGTQALTMANKVSSSIYPLMDDSWYATLNMIKDKTPQDTIINSWWDFGDWFKAVAKRRVIFDGQSQNNPQAYWMAKVILSNNEDEAVAILRMLNNGGNRAFEVIDEYIKDPLQSVLLLETVLTYDAERAKAKLLDFLPAPAVNEVLKLLFSNSGRAVFVVDPSMQGKIVAISYLGDWNFSKVYMAQKFNKMEKDQILEHLKKLGRDPNVMQQLYQEVFLIAPGSLDDWISKRLQFYSGLANGQEKDGLVFFEHGFIYNPKDQTVQANNGQAIPRSLFVLIEGKMTEIVYPKPTVNFSCLVVKTDKGYRSVLLDRELANSMFVRMYYFNGMGLKHFLPFIESQTGSEFIRVFTIAW